MTSLLRGVAPRPTLAVALLLAASRGVAWADVAPGDEEAARAHFQRGLALERDGAHDAALVEFLASRAQVPTRGNTRNAAVCLRELARYDEALDLLESLLREQPDMPELERTQVVREVGLLRERVGVIEIMVLEPGAAILVDGRERGRAPLSAPVRVAVGSHLVRVVKEGFEPWSVVVAVAGGARVPVDPRLARLRASGELVVGEVQGGVATVRVDSVVVGKTPWRGSVSPGVHAVVLEGEGQAGTQPATVRVTAGETSVLRASLEPLGASLRVLPSPRDARVALDGIDLGRGTWQGRVRAAGHDVEVAADGFVPVRVHVDAAEGSSRELTVTLERDVVGPFRPSPRPRFVAELRGAALVGAPMDDAKTCPEGCSRDASSGGELGVLARLDVAPPLSLGVELAGMSLQHRSRAVPFTMAPRGRPDLDVVADARTSLSAARVGAWAAIGTRGLWSLRGETALGVLVGRVVAVREGNHVGDYDGPPALGQATGMAAAYASPRVSVGRALGDRVSLSAGIGAFFAVLPDPPRWSADTPSVPVGAPGLARYTSDRVMPSVLASGLLFLSIEVKP